jgi:5'-nucleotidase
MKMTRATWLFCLASACTAAERAPECIALVATTDVHGAVAPSSVQVGQTSVRAGGLTAFSGYLTLLRQRYGKRLLLVDAGDLYHGTLWGKLSRGAAIIDAYNVLGYDAVALGNHEFDYGPLNPGDADPTGVLQARLRQARFPMLAANVFVDDLLQEPPRWPNFVPSTLVDVGGIPVGLIGVATPETPRVTRPQYVARLHFPEPAPYVIAEAKALRQRGARLVVLLAHMGGRCAPGSEPHDLSSCEADAELFRLLRALPPKTIDVAVGGHRHQAIAHWVEGVATLEATAGARHFGWLDACVATGGGIDVAKSTLHPLVETCLDEWPEGGCAARDAPAPNAPARFLGQPVVPSVELAAAMRSYEEEIRAAYARPLGIRLPAPLVVGGTPPLESLVTAGMAAAAGVPMAFQNRGGVRAALPAGPLSFGQVFEVLPFDNHVAVLSVTGAELESALRLLFDRRDQPPFATGVSAVAVDDKVEVRLANGAPLVADATYRVATNDYLAWGGEGIDLGVAGEAQTVQILDATVLDALIGELRRRFPPAP